MIRTFRLFIALIVCCILLSGIFICAASASDGTLRPYAIDKTRDIWIPEDPTSYIIPNNTIVQEYADRLYIDDDGWIKYKNEYQVWVRNQDGSVLYTNKVFKNNYTHDYEQFGSGNFAVGEDNDYWVNPDYYLTHGLQGDCEDVSIAIASMLVSGNLSIDINDTLVPTKINTSVNIGYYMGYRHVWVEYEIYNQTFIYSSTVCEERPFVTVVSFYTLYKFTDSRFGAVV